MGLRFNENYTVDDFVFVLSTRNFRHISPLVNVSEVHYKPNLNGSDELSFTVHKEIVACVDDYPSGSRVEPAWDKIQDLRLVWVRDLDEYFQIAVEQHDTDSPYKTLTCTSLCEAELGQINLYGLEINTLTDFGAQDLEEIVENPDAYIGTRFFDNEDHDHSLLHRVLKAAPHYSIGHVDESLAKDTRLREFSVDGTPIYDLLTGEVAEQYECLFTFDTKTRKVNAYDLMTTCNDCGYRGEFHFSCPNKKEDGTVCGSTNLSYFGKDTRIFVDRENLSDDIVFSGTPDEIKNCLRLKSGDDEMDTAIQYCNPNGTLYLYGMSEIQQEDMSDELKAALEKYDEACEEAFPTNLALAQELYETMDEYGWVAHSMMPTVETESEYTATEQAALLTKSALSPTGVGSLSEYTVISVVNTAVENYAKVIIKSGYFKVEVATKDENGNTLTPTLTTPVCDEDTGITTATWQGVLKVTNYSDEDDVAYTSTLTLEITDLTETYLKQKINKLLASRSEEEGSLFDVLSIEDLDEFEEALQYYSEARLKSFYSALEGCLGIMQEAGHSEKEADLYESLYVPWEEKWRVCGEIYNQRAAEALALKNECAEIENTLKKSYAELNLETFLEKEQVGLYKEFCAYRRDGEYSNDNYKSDTSTNDLLFERAQEFIEEAKKQIDKSKTNQFTISTSLHNLMGIPEFAKLIDNFEIGNWIRVGVDGVPYRLRLVSYDLTFDTHQTLNVEFSNLTKCPSVVSDIKSILDVAQGMATNYSYISKQAEKGQAAQETINDWLSTGLNSGLVQIQTGKNQEFTIDENGVHGRSYDDITGTYSPKELKIHNNIIAFTDDGWKSTKMVLGEHNYIKYDQSKNEWITDSGYGNTADFITAGYVNGSTIVGGKVYSSNYSDDRNGKVAEGTFIDLDKGEFSFAGGRLTYNGGDQILLTGVTIDWKEVNMPEIEGIGDIETALGNMNTSITNLYTGLQFTSISGQYVISPNIVGGQLLITSDDGTTSASISNDGVLTATGANITGTITAIDGTFSGTVTSTNGSIGGWELSSDGLSSTMTMTLPQFTSSDVTTVQNIIVGTTPLSEAYLEKYDLNKDGIIDGIDMILVNKLSNYYSQYKDCVGTIAINPNSFTDSLVLQSDSGAFGVMKTRIGVGSLETNSLKCTHINTHITYAQTFSHIDQSTGATDEGISGTFTDANGNTLTFKGGILVSYNS